MLTEHRYLDIPQIAIIPKISSIPGTVTPDGLLIYARDFLKDFFPKSLQQLRTCRSPGLPDRRSRELADSIVTLYIANHNPELLLSVTSESELSKLQPDYSSLFDRIIYGDAEI